MKLKEGVIWRDMHPSMWYARKVAEEACETVFGRECIVTSARDGTHSEHSLHYEGRAMDIRTRDQPEAEIQVCASWLRARLGPDFDVVVEKTHIHVEFDPD